MKRDLIGFFAGVALASMFGKYLINKQAIMFKQQYNDEVNKYNALMKEHNSIVNELNAVVTDREVCKQINTSNSLLIMEQQRRIKELENLFE